MSNTLVSVIVPVSDSGKFLASALDSILQQDYRHFEIIVVQKRVSNSSAPAPHSPGKIYSMVQSGEGLADARNSGIAASRGELIAFLDQDDLWTPNKLRLQVDYLTLNHSIQYVTAFVKLFVEPGCLPRTGYTENIFQDPIIGRTPGTLMARRSLFNQIGMFNAGLSIACDTEWFVRAMQLRIPTVILPDVLLHKRVHDNNLSSDVTTNKKELFEVIRQSLKSRIIA